MHTILIVDDEADLREAMAFDFERRVLSGLDRHSFGGNLSQKSETKFG
jgi:hypothetical protein